ncbi:HAD family hydrolase [Paracoccus mutanolyticus]|uniref:HAD family hydrolase n=1 Tax=Paracoccus mutanolyticus TaxID=1499308 RepID=UPI001CB9D404|nr:HAD family hydrolase [Paracoccus mutanolyticus]
MAQLLPGAGPDLHDRVVEGYRAAFVAARAAGRHPPLYPGALDCLDALAALPGVTLGIATGKPMRGLTAILAAHGLERRFATRQSADGHPSKPIRRLESALAERGAGGAGGEVGDTSFDMEMAQAAGMTGFGVDWGYHPAERLHATGAVLVAPDYPALTAALLDWAEERAA